MYSKSSQKEATRNAESEKSTLSTNNIIFRFYELLKSLEPGDLLVSVKLKSKAKM